ncbi:molybdopterin-dependent oxidoreductase [Conexibacter sp. DBS9H8]|uniref:molybdopterin-dependent oxidoreductase n=1 Tax=Conexibacter sp. DBS9H8 TaxID=2937801 RepID=UPI00200E509B|nr:molybdopterin-dependent oxidoreductase [Conexibacter sp. DBS9H8]
MSPPPGPFRPTFWRSPLRSPQLTAILGLVLLIGLPVVAITGLLSNDAYQPGLGANALGRNIHGPLDIYLFGWPTSPSWLYALTQGVHVSLGLALFPVVLVKLWSVIPKLFEWPPVRSPAHVLERLSLALLVGGALFEFATGILDIQYWYAFPFSFPQAHYYGGWVFIGALIFHVGVKFSTMRRSLATREELAAVVGPGAAPRPEHPLVAPNPSAPTMPRRALFGAVGAASVILLLQGVGDSLGGPLRPLAFLLPRGAHRSGPLGFQVNRTWAQSGLSAARLLGADWRLTVSGPRSVTLSRAELLALPQHTYDLPIACVEGWSTTQRWTGVALADLAALTGAHGRLSATSVSVAPGTYGQATLGHEEVADPRTLLALAVNGVPLDLDHGFPARVIGPAVPGVHCTKWVRSIHFQPEPA